MMRRFGLAGSALLACCLFASVALAQVPTSFHFQGVLSDAEGTPIEGTLAIRLAIYADPEGGEALWSQSREVSIVAGAVDIAMETIDPALFLEDGARWFGVTVGDDAEMAPRTPFTSVPYALRALSADNALSPDQVADVIKDDGRFPWISEVCDDRDTLVYDTSSATWLCAPSTLGPPGPKGDTGDRGPAGPVGATGAVGPAGPAGPAGERGPVGATGAVGPAGATGAIGSAGPVGPRGPAGERGAVGATGAQGPVGPIGPAGPVGATGARGLTGLTGTTGATGATGTQGPIGPQGPAGAPRTFTRTSSAVTTCPYANACSAVATCSAGSVVGGGCDFVNPRQFVSQPAAFQASFPSASNAWSCRADWPRNSDQNAQGTITLQAFAICAQ